MFQAMVEDAARKLTAAMLTEQSKLVNEQLATLEQVSGTARALQVAEAEMERKFRAGLEELRSGEEAETFDAMAEEGFLELKNERQRDAHMAPIKLKWARQCAEFKAQLKGQLEGLKADHAATLRRYEIEKCRLQWLIQRAAIIT